MTDVVDYLKTTKDLKKDNVIICPSNIYIPYFIQYKFNVGIQDISIYDSGLHTGAVLAQQASSLGIKYAIVGHSERHDTTDIINKKIMALNKYNITSVLCVGEEKTGKKTKKIIKQYLTECLNNTLVSKVIIAYEPVWAIGTNELPDKKYIEDIILFIKDFVKKTYDYDIKVLYGGSVNKDNISTIKLVEGLDGIFVGNASSIPSEFKEIISKYLD